MSVDTIICPALVRDYHDNGVVYLRGIFKDWVDILAGGIEYNMHNPSEYAAENVIEGGRGRSWLPYGNIFYC